MSKRLQPVHPGEVLLKDFLGPMEISQYRLAKDTHIAAQAINDIVRCRRSVTAEVDLRLSRYFGISEGVFLGIQTEYDLENAKLSKYKSIEREVTQRAAGEEVRL